MGAADLCTQASLCGAAGGINSSSCSSTGNGNASSSSSSSSSLWRQLSSAFSKNFDSLITPLLADGDMHVQQQRPDWATDEDGVLNQALEFRARNKVVVPHLRRFWAISCIVGMCVWLFVDVYCSSANGLVPGLKDTWVIESTPFSEAAAQQQQEDGTTTICSCTFNSTNHYSHPPYTMLVLNAGKALPSFHDFLGYCDNPFNTSMPSNATESRRFLTRVLDEFFYQLASMRLMAPTSAIMLPVEGWRAARFAEAFRAAMGAMTAAQAHISSAPVELLSDEALSTGLDVVTRLQMSFTAALGKLLEMPDHAMTTEMVDPFTNQSTPLKCSPPSKADLPLALLEWCRPPGVQMTNRLTNEDDNRKGCSDPYQAYVSWCAPTLCHTLGPKPPYLQAMQVMAALGGLYSIISLFAFAILWRLVFCSIERKVDLDGVLQWCCGQIRAAGACCLTALGVPSAGLQPRGGRGLAAAATAASSTPAGAGPAMAGAVCSASSGGGGGGGGASVHCVCQIDVLMGMQAVTAATGTAGDSCKHHCTDNSV